MTWEKNREKKMEQDEKVQKKIEFGNIKRWRELKGRRDKFRVIKIWLKESKRNK